MLRKMIYESHLHANPLHQLNNLKGSILQHSSLDSPTEI